EAVQSLLVLKAESVEAGKEGLVGREDGQTDEFLVGMRVLAVDGDLTFA
ncbi:unnamed protein product, partial [Musa textilis]